MEEQQGQGLPVKKFVPEVGAVDSDLRFLRRGDLFWYEVGGKPTKLPERYAEGATKKFKALMYVAVGSPLWVKERNGPRVFTGIRFRAASESEIKIVAHTLNQTIRGPRS